MGLSRWLEKTGRVVDDYAVKRGSMFAHMRWHPMLQ